MLSTPLRLTPPPLLLPPHSSRFHRGAQPHQVCGTGCKPCTALYFERVAGFDAPLHGSHSCICVYLVYAGPAQPRVDSSGKPACEQCGIRLRGQPTLPCGIGRKCKPRCKAQLLQPSTASHAADAAAAIARPRKRRAASDPGEQPAASPQLPTRPMTRRVAPPRPAPGPKMPRIARSHEELMRLLDETVAGRMAHEAAQAATAGGTQQ